MKNTFYVAVLFITGLLHAQIERVEPLLVGRHEGIQTSIVNIWEKYFSISTRNVWSQYC